MTDQTTPTPAETPLESWKAIAAYLNRDARTVMRWEKSEGLPVHRHRHLARSTVYAFPSELDTWRANRRLEPSVVESVRGRFGSRLVVVAATLAITLLSAGGGRFVGPLWAQQDRASLVPTEVGLAGAERISTAGDATGRPSADGRYVAFADWSDGLGNLAVRDLFTGQTHRLTTDASSTGWVGHAIIAPDGNRVAYRWEGRDESTRLIDRDGRNMRVLTRHPYGESIRAWSRDGKWLAGVQTNEGTDRTSRIVLISTSDGAVTQLKSMGWQQPNLAGGFSPDGRYLTYSLPNADAPRASIFVIATDGSAESLVTNDGGSPEWSPDGSRLVFRSPGPSGSPGLWSVRIADGRPNGDPELLLADAGGAGISSRGFSADGSYYYVVTTAREDAYIADFDASTVTVAGAARVSDQAPGRNRLPAISPDGRRVAFLRALRAADLDAASTSGPRSSNMVLVVRDLEDGNERTYADVPQLNPIAPLLWDPDGSSILLLPIRHDLGVIRFELASGTYESILRPAGDMWNTLALSPDGGALFYTAIETIDGRGPLDLKRLRLMKRTLDAGRDEEIYQTESRGLGFFGLTVSSDEAWLAFSINVGDDERSVMVMPASGGEAVEIFRTSIDGISHVGSMIWTPDNAFLILSADCGPGGTRQLCALPREGGSLRLVGMNMQTISSRMISADGKRIAFTGSTSDSELWVIRGLLPSAQAARQR